MKRRSLPSAIEVEVLTKCARRCALCFGLDGDLAEKKGQIAHLDKNSSNHSISNLVFLCLNHHDCYDGRSSQSKGYRKSEVIHYRDLLQKSVVQNIPQEQRFEKETAILEKQLETVSSIADRYLSLERSVGVLEQQIMARAQAIHEFSRRYNEWVQKQINSNFDEKWDNRHEWYFNWLLDLLSIPEGVYGLNDSYIPDSWIETVEYLVSVWTSGHASYDECTELIWELDERYDFDMHWILFGIPNDELPRLAYQLLQNFVYVFGLRAQSQLNN